jgi:hypothetical protein
MATLVYHAGQRAVQMEANTVALADHLASWVGPVAEFATQADLFLLAAPDAARELHFTVLSGPEQLASVAGPGTLALHFPEGAELEPGRYGGLAINLSLARRARLNGELRRTARGYKLEADETFTLCRKYMAPSVTLGEGVSVGPCRVSEGDATEAAALLANAETVFLASISPDGGPDVAHRGGPAGFIHFDPASGEIEWPEFLGDGVFKSAGNIRATGCFTLLVPDFDTGSGFELVCRDATYANTRTSRVRRLDPLVQHNEPFPDQGTIRAKVERVVRLTSVVHPRKRIEKALKVTSRSSVDEQAPQ